MILDTKIAERRARASETARADQIDLPSMTLLVGGEISFRLVFVALSGSFLVFLSCLLMFSTLLVCMPLYVGAAPNISGMGHVFLLNFCRFRH